jgi:RNA polymerase sigma factor (sigma-70 family)
MLARTLPDRSATDDARFPTTRRSAVRGAGSGDPRERERAWEALVAAYWKPAYKHVRIRWKAAPEDAEDAIQGFFERALEKDFFASYDAGRGRFRTFLRVCLDRHVENLAKARRRQKRGGGAAVLPLDFDAAEDEIARAGAAAWVSPEECFDREWRRSVLTLAIEALGQACAADGKSVCFALFERYDLCAAERRPTYADLGRDFGIPATTVTNHLAFARRELRRLVVAKLREITGGEDELEAEARLLLGARPR